MRFSGNKPQQAEKYIQYFKLSGEALVVELTESKWMACCGEEFSADSVSGSDDITVSLGGSLTWASTANKDKNFTVAFTNECGKSRRLRVSLKIYHCPCANGGTCKHDEESRKGSDNYICQCPQEFQGELCDDTDLSAWTMWGSCSEPCGGGKATRSRSCVGDRCTQLKTLEERQCNTQECTSATEAEWSEWSNCTKECDSGLTRRTRSCPVSQCEGNQEDVELCNEHQCDCMFLDYLLLSTAWLSEALGSICPSIHLSVSTLMP